MNTQVSAIETAIIVAAAGGLGLYYWVLYRTGILKPNGIKVAAPEGPINHIDIIPRQLLTEGDSSKMILPPTIPSVAVMEEELEAEDESQLEFLDEEGSVLLKEAEKVVDKIQDTINNIASNPANPEEVTSKIQSVVGPCKLLMETEYYDSINTYIALAVERDCGIKLSPEELQTLWN